MNSLPTIAAIVAAIIGTGGLVSLLQVRAANRKSEAETRRIETASELDLTAALHLRYDKLFDELQIEVSRLRASELECRTTLNATLQIVADLRVAASEATHAVSALQERMARIEASP